MNRIAAMLAVLAALPAAASAQVIITEIMYDLAERSDSGREWIEVYNAGEASVDLSAWRLFESDSNHKMSGIPLPPGTYAVIADDVAEFRADWPAFAGIVYESAFSLNNDGESIELRQGTRVIDAVSYESGMGGDGTGDSLQRIENSFMPGAPTPGADIPPEGLMSAPLPEETAPVPETAILGERRTAPAGVAAAAASSGSWQWWLAPLVISAFASGGIVLFRRRLAEEWQIEEME